MLGGAKRVSVARHFKDAAASRGLNLNVLSYELSEEVPIASEGRVIKGLRFSDAGVRDDLLRVIRSEGVDLVLPFVDPAVEVVASLRGATDAFVPVSDERLCRVMFDKSAADDWFRLHSIPVPDRVALPLEGKVVLPIILKPRCGSASKGITICRRESDIPAEIDAQTYMAQRYVADAEEVTADCYVDRAGRVLSVVPRIRLETAGGEVTRSITVRDQALIALVRRVLDAGAFRGPVTVQLLRDRRNGQSLVMEVNPRLGGGVVTSIAAGSGILDMLIGETLGERMDPVDDWRDHTLVARYLAEVVFTDC